jgi:hypothetical protein
MIEECIFNFIINITWQLLPYYKRKEKKKERKKGGGDRGVLSRQQQRYV